MYFKSEGCMDVPMWDRPSGALCIMFLGGDMDDIDEIGNLSLYWWGRDRVVWVVILHS